MTEEEFIHLQERLAQVVKHTPEKEPSLNANSAIIGVSSLIIMAALTLVWNTTQTTATGVTKLETQVPYITTSVAEMKAQIGGMVTRAELDSRMKQSDESNRELIKQIIDGKH